jgi:uncharacterized DUF497 family protein
MQFEWDAAKAAANRRKHGVSFAEAETAFADPSKLEFFDEEHSDTEDRYRLIGMSTAGRLLAVSYTDGDEATRIISARKATRAEERLYRANEP